MFKEKEFSNLRLLNIHGKDLYVVDRHQYTLPLWASKSLSNNMKYELVSIDYHPDTNPPFWQKAYLKAVNENRFDDSDYIDKISDSMLARVSADDLEAIKKLPEHLNNDEHINTAMGLNYLSDYHMINCMDEHLYKTGKHYLIEAEYFGSLKDGMFSSIAFKVPDESFILDIDLDYFLEKSSFDMDSETEGNIDEFTIFKRLVRECEFITMARSIKYFNYLRREDFEIEECEELMIDMINKILKNGK